MRLADLLAPIGLDAFRDRYLGQRPFVLKPPEGQHPFRHLISSTDLEARLNDGVATQITPQAIASTGAKLPPATLTAPQRGRAWSRQFRHKRRLHELLDQGHSLVLHNNSQLNPAIDALCGDLEALLPHGQADLHIYLSPRASSTGYHAHQDVPQHKLYLQWHGTTAWTIFRGSHPARALPLDEARAQLQVDIAVELGPGSLLYLPPGTFHHATNPHGPRVSLSFPFHSIPDADPVDRHHIPLTHLLELP